ncbi:MAG: hypothetical protein LWW85_02355 [Marinilabiliales bacterium]|nr:hypothetical protein [Marinilabiliales bacterium]
MTCLCPEIVRKSLKYNLPEYLDTYARILYRMGGRREAMEWQKKAIAQTDSIGLPNREYKEVVARMEAGTP